ncbi:MAG: hypothetical protein ACFFCS_21530, partial [Candidatus Hodarchaeota archaeon]
LTTIQFLRYFGLFPDPGTQQELFVTSYSGLIFLYSFILAAILSPIYYFADLNIMFYTRHEGMTFLVPFGTKILPVLKGFGSFSIIISFLVFVITNFSLGDVPLTVTLDPLITLFIPILFIMGFEIISPIGKKYLKKWLEKMNIESFDDLSINLIKKPKLDNQVEEENRTS